MSNTLLDTSFTADAAIANNRIIKHGTGDRNVTFSAAATDLSIGILNGLPPVNGGTSGVAAGERLDVTRVGIAWLEAGAAFARGSKITSDAVGRGIVAAPAAGSNVQIIAIADEAATAAGDVVRVLIAPSVMQG